MVLALRMLTAIAFLIVSTCTNLAFIWFTFLSPIIGINVVIWWKVAGNMYAIRKCRIRLNTMLMTSARLVVI